MKVGDGVQTCPNFRPCRYGTFGRTLHYLVFAEAWPGEGVEVEDYSTVTSLVEPGAPTVPDSNGSE